jgi:N-acetylneuraminic acid mutarotase
MKKHFVNRTVLFCIIAVSLFNNTKSQTYNWKKGTNLLDQISSYGPMGVFSATNLPGGRQLSATWKDGSGNFWLYGGIGTNSMGNSYLLGDLWKYDPTSNNWAWINGDSSAFNLGSWGTIGVSSPNNDPGSRLLSSTWTDPSGNFWMFGGMAMDASFNFGEMNDLWKYNPSTNEWTWMSGSTTCTQTGVYGTQGIPSVSNIPGARIGALTWFDNNGKLWLLGGQGYDAFGNSGALNDLWKFDPSTNEWTWIKGSNIMDQTGTYGTQGNPALTNNPGGRVLSATWKDASGQLWLFGGAGFGASGSSDLLNDLWKYNISSNQWTWMKGANSTTQSGSYGTLGVPASANVPGARVGVVAWTDATGNFCIFGGSGMDSTSTSAEFLNDIWKYNTTSNNWMWYKGSYMGKQTGVYGTQGIPSSFNTPGARAGSAGWTDSAGDLYLFGGDGYNYDTITGSLNDLWKLDNCLSPTLTVTSSKNKICLGDTALLNVTGATTYTWLTSQLTSSIVISPTVTTSYTVMGATAGCINSIVYTQPVVLKPILTASTNMTLSVCAGENATLSATGAQTYTWSNGTKGPTTVINPNNTVTLTVTGTSTNGCVNSTTVMQNVNPCLTVNENSFETTPMIFPNPNNGRFIISSEKINFEMIIYNSIGMKVSNIIISEKEQAIDLSLPGGIYFVTYSYNGSFRTARLVIE